MVVKYMLKNIIQPLGKKPFYRGEKMWPLQKNPKQPGVSARKSVRPRFVPRILGVKPGPPKIIPGRGTERKPVRRREFPAVAEKFSAKFSANQKFPGGPGAFRSGPRIPGGRREFPVPNPMPPSFELTFRKTKRNIFLRKTVITFAPELRF